VEKLGARRSPDFGSLLSRAEPVAAIFLRFLSARATVRLNANGPTGSRLFLILLKFIVSPTGESARAFRSTSSDGNATVSAATRSGIRFNAAAGI